MSNANIKLGALAALAMSAAGDIGDLRARPDTVYSGNRKRLSSEKAGEREVEQYIAGSQRWGVRFADRWLNRKRRQLKAEMEARGIKPTGRQKKRLRRALRRGGE